MKIIQGEKLLNFLKDKGVKIFLFIIISLALVYAGNVVVREGSLDADNNLSATKMIVEDSNVSGTVYGNRVNITAEAIEGANLYGYQALLNPQTGFGYGFYSEINSGEAYGVEYAFYANRGECAFLDNVYVGLDYGPPGMGGDDLYVSDDIFNDGDFQTQGDIKIDANNKKLFFGENQDAYVYWDGANLVFNYNSTNATANAWFSRNISATGYITRTSIYDKSKGSALNYIRDADTYKTNGEVDHSKFEYSKVSYEVADLDTCREVLDYYIYCYGSKCYKNADEILEGREYSTIAINKTICDTKTEEGINLNSEVDVLRQAVYELKTELCNYNAEYSWC